MAYGELVDTMLSNAHVIIMQSPNLSQTHTMFTDLIVVL